MLNMPFNNVVLAILPFLVPALAQQQPLLIAPNTDNTFGPDGPWNAWTIEITGHAPNKADFYPILGFPTSILVNSDVCSSDGAPCLSPQPAYFSFDGGPAGPGLKSDGSQFSDVAGTISSLLGMSGEGYYWLEHLSAEIDIQNVSSMASQDITVKQGRTEYRPLSLMSLDNADYLHLAQVDDGSGAAQTTTLMQGNYNKGAAGSFGLHMGAAMFNQPGSWYMGGYDSNRVIERPLTVDWHVGFSLVNVSFDSLATDNPWAGSTGLPSNFLSGPVNVTLAPHAPYLYFPQRICNALSSYLPISYDSDSQLYLWKTSDPMYTELMSTLSYMSFTFAGNPPVTIRVPFATLNLNLTAPLKSSPTPYFPCSAREDAVTLGRAFLQSAFYMQAYTPTLGSYVLAQAPGPSVNKNTQPNAVAVPQSNPVASTAANPPKWEDTWSGVLKTSSSGSGSSGSSSSGASAASAAASAPGSSSISGGAIAGIVIGVTALLALAAAAAVFFLRRRNRGSGHTVLPQEAPDSQFKSPMQAQQHITDTAFVKGAVMSEKEGSQAIHQIDSRPVQQRFEMDSTNAYDRVEPTELYAGDFRR